MKKADSLMRACWRINLTQLSSKRSSRRNKIKSQRPKRRPKLPSGSSIKNSRFMMTMIMSLPIRPMVTWVLWRSSQMSNQTRMKCLLLCLRIFSEAHRRVPNNYFCKLLRIRLFKMLRTWLKTLGNGWLAITTSKSLRSMFRDTGLRNRKEISWITRKLKLLIRKEILR
jgi:hypothetical protein